MLVSIIITCYNHKDYIEDTLNSIINQTYTDWELLIGDDSPGGECWNIIQKFVKKYPDKIHARHNSPSKWIVWNMKFLLSNISKESEYVAVLEWDDLYAPDNLSTKMEIFQKYPNVKLVYNECSTVDKDWHIIKNKSLKNAWCKYFYQDEKIKISDILCSLIPIYHSRSSIMFSVDCIKKYDISIPTLSDKNLISDFIFFTKVSTNEYVYWLTSPLTLYRVHDNNVSTSTNNSLCRDLIIFWKYLYSLNLIDGNTLKKVKTKSYITLCFSFLKKSLLNLVLWFKENSFYALKVIISKIYYSIRMK